MHNLLKLLKCSWIYIDNETLYSFLRWRDRVIHRYSNSFSGFAAWLSEEEAKLIAQRPEVVSVFPDPVLQLHTTRSWDFLKEQSGVGLKPRQVPKSKSSLSGEDVIIGILDTGIWPEAQSFSDKGLGPIPKRWKGKCITGPDFKSSNCNRYMMMHHAWNIFLKVKRMVI